MSTVTTGLMTAEEFWEWCQRPENEGRRFELDSGEVIEMPSPGELHGVVCFLIARLLGNFLFARKVGYLCTNDSGLVVARGPDTVRGPDIMLFLESKAYEQLSRKYADRNPALIVEVLSPSDNQGRVNRRINQYQVHGIPLVWLVDPESRIVTVYRPGQAHLPLDEGDELSGDLAPAGFRCRVADLFTLPDPGA
jgi:Uma2 family endonuclease